MFMGKTVFFCTSWCDLNTLVTIFVYGEDLVLCTYDDYSVPNKGDKIGV